MSESLGEGESVSDQITHLVGTHLLENSLVREGGCRDDSI